jgi:hypothetical protein
VSATQLTVGVHRVALATITTSSGAWLDRTHFSNVVSDIQHGPGANNELVDSNGFVVRTAQNNGTISGTVQAATTISLDATDE